MCQKNNICNIVLTFNFVPYASSLFAVFSAFPFFQMKLSVLSMSLHSVIHLLISPQLNLLAVSLSFSKQLISFSSSFAFKNIFHPLDSLFSSFLHLSFSPSPSCILATFSVYQSRQAHYDFISQTTLAVPFSECWLGAGRRFLKILIMEHGKWLIIQQAMSHSPPD